MNDHQHRISPRILQEIIDRDQLRDVVKRALDFRKQATQHKLQKLEKEIQNYTVVPGFSHNPGRAPTQLLLDTVMHCWDDNDPLLISLLLIWIESHRVLQSESLVFLNGKDISVIESKNFLYGFVSIWKIPEMWGIVDEFCSSHPEFDRAEVAIMFCCLTGKAPLPEDALKLADERAFDYASEEEDHMSEQNDRDQISNKHRSLRWVHWLEELQNLPADALEWDQSAVRQFIDSVEELAQSKRSEYESRLQILNLQAEIDSLVEQYDDDLRFFGLTRVSCWTAEICPAAEVSTTKERIEQLGHLLGKYRGLQQTRADNLHAQRQLRDDMNDLETRIVELHLSLSGLLHPDDSANSIEDNDTDTVVSESPADSASVNIKSVQEETAFSPATTSNTSVAEGADEEITEVPVQDDIETSGEQPQTPEIDISDESEVPETEALPSTTDDAVVSSPETQPDINNNTPVTAEPQQHTSKVPEEQTTTNEQDSQQNVLEVDNHVPVKETVPVEQESETTIQEPSSLIHDPQQQFWHGFMWKLIAQDDLPGAYWLARSLTASGLNSPVPDWLIAAIQGAIWLSHDTDLFINDLFEIALMYQIDANNTHIMLGLSAALRTSLKAPETGLISWLLVPECCPEFQGVVDTLQVFVSRVKRAPRPEELSSVTGAEQLDTAISEAAQAARQWLDEARGKKTTLKRATDVWHELVGVDGDLRSVLLPVAEDYRDGVATVQQQLQPWMSSDYVHTQIHRIDSRLAGKAMRPIDGRILQRLVRDISNGCILAKRWCDLVEVEQESHQPDWLSEHIAALLAGLQHHLPAMEARLLELISEDQPAAIPAVASTLWRATTRLRDNLKLTRDVIDDQRIDISDDVLIEWVFTDAESLNHALSRRLLLLPEINLTDDGEPADAALPDIASALHAAYIEQRSLVTAFDSWLQKEDYRFVEQICIALQGQSESEAFVRRVRDARTASQSHIEALIQKANSALEQAVVDGIIAEEDRSNPDYSKAVNIDAAELDYFAPAHDRLRFVHDDLDQKRKQRLGYLQNIWNDLQLSLDKLHIDPERQQGIQDFVASALSRGDTRVVEESLSRLTEVMDTGAEFEETWFTPTTSRDVLQEFQQVAHELERSLGQPQGLREIQGCIRDGRTYANIPFGNIPVPRRKEALSAINCWQRLKQRPSTTDVQISLITPILTFLGFTLEETATTTANIKERGKDWLYIRLPMTDGGLSRPIPQFGSQAQGIYDVIILWERPGADTIAARLENLRLSMHSVLVIYLGRLTMKQRRNVVHTSIGYELSAALLDEVLMIFLAQERDARLSAFLRCALPFTAVNPYTPFQAGDVPVEMFFGRREMARELQRPTGSCLVYGGRQLGKSALLRHVQREFDNHERQQYAWVEDIKTVGDSKAGQPDTSIIWRKLRDIFQHRFNLIKTKSDKPEEIERHIRQAMEKEPQRRVLIMFDEADNFLRADANQNFHIVDQLRALMFDTQRRFKVVFAGLENVQRYQGIPNQPLAHFGKPICVRPLEPDAAQHLIRDPLEVLGYRFADNATILRILSYTNYHPGLIQIFCHDLLKRLHKNIASASRMPPYSIEQERVENIYRDPQIRERIRERFNWTLALDTRYEAIAWALIDDQMDEHDSYARAYSPGEILSLAHYWWKQGFRKADVVRLRSLLEEMCGLGVLVRNADGHYRLRSPNLVRLMGTEADIQARLLELEKKQPEVRFNADSHHAILDETRRPLRYSPMTHAQESNLNPQRFGVGLVFASRATGLSDLPDALRGFLPRDFPDAGIYAEIPGDITDSTRLEHWLEHFLKQHQKLEQLILCHRMKDVTSEQMIALIQTAITFCQRQHAKKRWMRLLFVFDPSSTWKWLSVEPSVREQLENQVDAVEYLRRWDEIGVRQWLEQHDQIDSQEIRTAVIDATGGWAPLLDHLFEKISPQDEDPRTAANNLIRELEDTNAPLRQKFSASLGLVEDNAILQILQFIRDEGEGRIEREYITPHLIGGSPLLHSAQCAAAIEYLYRMGCIEFDDDDDDVVLIEPTVSKVVE